MISAKFLAVFLTAASASAGSLRATDKDVHRELWNDDIRNFRAYTGRKPSLDFSRFDHTGLCLSDHHHCGVIWGDPHIQTFDGLHYDCQGVGEFIVAKSLDSAFQVQAHFEEGNRINSKKGAVSVTQAIAIDTGRTYTNEAGEEVPVPELDVHSVYHPEKSSTYDKCSSYFYVNGEFADFGEDGKKIPGIEFMPNVMVRSARNKEEPVDFVYFYGSGVLATIRSKMGGYGCVMDLKLCLPDYMIKRERIVGLMGNANDDPADDFISPAGHDLRHNGNTKWQYGYDYCTKNWCVDNPADSIFETENAQNPMNAEWRGKCKNEYDNSAKELVDNPTDACKFDCEHIFDAVNDKNTYEDCLLECEAGDEPDAFAAADTRATFEDIENQCPDPAIPPVVPPVEPAPEIEPRLAPPPVTTKSQAGAFGDPHVRTWSGEHYSYHGACDLVLVHNPKFENGLGMDIHIRNKPIKHWSYIETAVLRIGSETLEVKGGEKTNEFWVNGVLGNPDLQDGDLPETISGYPIKFSWLTNGRRRFVVDLGNGEEVIFKTFKYFIRVNVRAKKAENFNSSVGLMGTYPAGNKIGRDGKAIEDYDAFGGEWQVKADEPMLFHAADGPQAPLQCVMPTATTERRLAESAISLEEAEIACAHVNIEDKSDCVFDILVTEDQDMAGAY